MVISIEIKFKKTLKLNLLKKSIPPWEYVKVLLSTISLLN